MLNPSHVSSRSGGEDASSSRITVSVIDVHKMVINCSSSGEGDAEAFKKAVSIASVLVFQVSLSDIDI